MVAKNWYAPPQKAATIPGSTNSNYESILVAIMMKSLIGFVCMSLVCVSCASRTQSAGAPRTLAPLPPDYSLGASSLEERDEICEAVIRFVAANHGEKYCFIGFENHVQRGSIRHDPTNELMARLRDLSPRVMPVSRAKWGRMSDGIVVDTEHSRHGAVYLLWGFSKTSADEAIFGAKVKRGVTGGSISYQFRLVRKDGKWRTVEEKPMSFLG
jgi:hypothetical protein